MPDLPLTWTLGQSSSAQELPTQWVSARIPGAVQDDWARAQGWPDVRWAGNVDQYRPLERAFWHYQSVIPQLTRKDDQRLILTIGGVDYAWELWLGNQCLHRHQGMFSPQSFDLTDLAHGGEVLRLLVLPAPKRPGVPEGRWEASASVKPPFNYGWDWHPRLVSLGAWKPITLSWQPAQRMTDFSLQATVAEHLGSARIVAEFQLSALAVVVLQVLDPDGHLVASHRQVCQAGSNHRLQAHLEQPALWWPQGHGAQPRYIVRVQVLDAQSRAVYQEERRIGLRHLRLVMHPGAWEFPSVFPKSRSNAPITVQVNGRPIFSKGSNWIPCDTFAGCTPAERIERLVTLAAEAGFNTLRLWGGSGEQADIFYETCDRLGLLVTHEFPLACGNYPDDEDYLQVLEQEALSMVRRRRHHPCIALWCGGNELFNAWSGMTDQSLALRLLHNVCYAQDRDRPYLPTFPVEGMGHGHYVLFDPQTQEEIHQLLPRSTCTAHSEIGINGPSPLATLTRIIPQAEQWPPRPSPAWTLRHGFNAWLGDTWLATKTYERFAGPARDLEDLVERGQRLQAAGIHCIFEESRRQAPRCSMVLSWCFNDAWPTAAGTSMIAWPDTPKPAYFAAKAACRTVLSSARLPRLAWVGGTRFQAELWLLNDGPQAVEACTIHAAILIHHTRVPLGSWPCPGAAAQENTQGPTLSYLLPATGGWAQLQLQVEGHPERDSSYELWVEPVAQVQQGPRSLNQ